jgi:RimJ/RimL family protein N-acetyltransferase
MSEFRFATTRLVLREWRDRDARQLQRLCSDLRVMEFLGPPLTMDEIEAVIARQRTHQNEHGFCFWAIELRSTRQMLGFCGIQLGPQGTPIADLPEIGWRLAYDHWGRSYAREAAEAALDWYWANIANETVWSITVPGNLRSWGLMERLGMQRQHDLDFDHPRVPDGSTLKRHITYKIDAPKSLSNYPDF